MSGQCTNSGGRLFSGGRLSRVADFLRNSGSLPRTRQAVPADATSLRRRRSRSERPTRTSRLCPRAGVARAERPLRSAEPATARAGLFPRHGLRAMMAVRIGRSAGRSPRTRVSVSPRGRWKRRREAPPSSRARAFTRVRGGKSGLHRARWWITSTPGNGCGRPPRTANGRESATESVPPRAARPGVRVKRCGAQALNVRAHQRRGDPPARQTPPEARSSRGQGRPGPLRSSGRPLDPAGNGGAR